MKDPDRGGRVTDPAPQRELTTRELARLRDDVRYAHRDLVDPRERGIIRDNGTTTRHIADLSLLGQLREATGSNGGRPNGPRKTTPMPIDPDAVDLLAAITTTAADLYSSAWHADTNPATADGDNIEQHLAATVAMVCRRTNGQHLLYLHRTLADWVRTIDTMLDPPRRFHLAAPCPACDARMVWQDDPRTGERVQVPALHVDGMRGCVCLNPKCGHVWPTTHLHHLAEVIGCDPIHEAS